MRLNAWVLASLLLASPVALGANLTSLAVSPTSVVGVIGGATGTVTLDAPAPIGGTVVSLSSNRPAASVPASITVAEGATTATFAVTTTTVAANTALTLTATYNAVNRSANLTVMTLLSAFSIAPVSVVGSMSATGTVALNAPAPAGGAVLTLSSSVPARVTVPASITIPAGASLYTFAIPTLLATTTGYTTITVANDGFNRTATLTTSAAPIPDSVALAPSTAFGSSTSTATVAMNGLGVPGGTVVTLTSSNTAAATVPASVTVPAGVSSTTFTVTTFSVATNTNVTITAASGATSKTATLTVAPSIQAFSTTLDRMSVPRGEIPTATIALNGPAPAGGATVTLTSSSTPNATVPASVVVGAGARSATFSVTTLTTGTLSSVTISAAYGGATKTAVLALTASPTVLSVAFSPSVVAGGQPSTGTVTISGPAPTGGAAISLLSADAATVSIPASITVSAGAFTATFQATTTVVGSDVATAISATLGATSAGGSLIATAPVPTGVALAPTTVVGGNPSTGTVTISAAAPPGGVPVYLMGSNTLAATVPASVTVAAGATSAAFTVTTLGVAAATPATISAVKQQTSVVAPVTVNPADLVSVVLSPTTLVAGTPSTGTVTLNGMAKPGGSSVALTSSDPTKATVPASVLVAAGATAATFTVTTLGLVTPASPTISAIYNGTTKSGTLTIQPATLSAFSISATPVVGGNNVTGTVTLNGKAASSSYGVALSSSDTICATVPATVTVATNATTATFTVTTLGVAANKSSTITATLAGVSRTVVISTTPAALTSVTLSPTAVGGGASSTGTLTLNGNAPPTGAVVLTTSSDGAATVPATVTIAANTKTKTFTVTTTPVAIAHTATISGTYSSTTQTAALTINPPVLSNVSLSPTTLGGGASATGTVTLSSIALPGGFAVNLTSNKAEATLPASVTVAQGATTATFTVTTVPVATVTTATITATAGAVTKTANLTINPPALSSVSLSPTTLGGGASATGTVTLSSVALAGGFAVNLTSNKAEATLPASVTVAQGAITATFTVTTVPAGTVTTATITATAGVVTKTANLTINPPALSSVFLGPNSVCGGTSTTGTVTLSSPALASGFAVNLTSNKAEATVPASVTVAQGATTATFTVTTVPVGTVTTATITATAGAVTKTAALTINPPAVSSLSLSPTSVACGAGSTGAVTLTGPAASSGVVVSLSSNDPSAIVPPTVTVAGNATSATFNVSTTAVAATRTATISATYSAGTKTAALTVNPAALSSISVSPTIVDGGTSAIGTVTLTGIATTSGFAVSLTSDNASATPPASVTVVGGASTATFSVSTSFVGGTATAQLTASAAGVTKTTTLTVKPVALALASLTLNPAFLTGGAPFTGTATLTAPAPSGGFAVSLSSDNAAATVPASVTVPAGTTTSTFTVTTAAVGTATTATVTGTASAVTKTAILTINPPSGTVIGSVRDALTGVAVPQAVVTITGTATTTTTDGSGSFSLPAIPGNRTLTVTAFNRQPATAASLAVTAGQTTDAGAISVGAPQGFAFDVRPAIASGAGTATAMVYLVAVAPAGGAVFTLTSDSASFVVPASVTVPAGLRVLTFPVTYTPVASSTWVTISATNASVTNQAHVTLTPGPTVASVSLALQSTAAPIDSVFGPADLLGTVALSEPAPAGGLSILLSSSSSSAVSVPVTILVPAGALLVTFPVHAATVAATTTSTITASLPNGGASALLTDTPAPALTSISVGRGSVTAGWMPGLTYLRSGASIQIQIALNAIAPAGGVVNLISSNPAVVPVPATVPVNTDASLTLGAGSASSVVITATYAGVSRSTVIAVSNAITAQSLAYSLGFSFILFLTGTPTGAVASFYSSNPSVIGVPSTATVTAGNDFTMVSPSVTRGPYDALVVLSGSSLGREVTTPLIDVAPATAPSSLSVYPSSGSGTVSLNTVAPTGGVTVLLGSSVPSVLSIPTSVFVPAGTGSASFSFSSSPVASATFVSVTATSAGVTVAKSLTVQPPMVTSLSLSPTSVPGGNTSIGTVTLNGPAPAPGYPLSLSSSHALASVPAMVIVPEGASSATFTITAAVTMGSASATITATNGLSTATAVLSITPTSIASLSLSPSSVAGGNPSTGTVTLNGLAPAGGALVSLSSGNTSAATVPSSVTIPAGTSSATFSVTTYPVVSTTNLTITATFGSIQNATLTVTPLAATLTSVTVAPTVVNGGLPATGRVWLSTAAGGLVVSLSSSAAAVASTPPSVTVPPGASFADFAITTTGVATTAAVTISAICGGVTRTAVLTVDPAILSSVALSPFSLSGGAQSTATVSMIGKAHTAGVVLTPSTSDSNVATVPASVTVVSGASTATFTVSTNSALTTGSATISATGGYWGNTATALLTITPAPVHLASFSLTASSVVAGGFVDATVTLNAPAPAGHTSIALSSTNPSIAPISSVNLAPGGSSATVRVSTNPVSSSSLVTLSATYNGGTMSAPLTVTPATPASITFTPSPIGGGYTTSGTLTFNGVTPAGTVVTFASSNPTVAAVPASVTTATAASTASFAVTTTTVSSPTPVTITATLGASSVIGVLSVDPVGLASVTGGLVTLNAPAPAGGFSIAMTISGAALFWLKDPYGYDTFKASTVLLIAAGQTQGSVPLLLEWTGTAGKTYTVTATLNGVTRSATGTVPAGTATFTINPAEVGQGGTAYGVITFDTWPNYTDNFPVDLSSSAAEIVLTDAHPLVCPHYQCDGTRYIHVGTAWTFPISVAANSGTGATTISATFLEYTATAPLTVAPAATLSGVAPGWVVAGDTTPVIYGSGIQPGSTVTFTGPVYSLTDFQHPLCSTDGTCPSSALPATLDPGGTYAAFAVPAGASPGIYLVNVRTPSGFDSSNSEWIGIDAPERTLPAVSSDRHNYTKQVYPGQTVIGTLTGNSPASGISDYNYYFFVATAGAHLNVTMQRADTSVPWENAASLDPQLEVIAPDGFIYQNLQGFDDVPGSDLNASITDAVLPQTGLYVIAAETTRGAGQYRLTFNLSAGAPLPAGTRAIALSGSGFTLPLNRMFTAYAIMLDPRGYPVAGADVTFAVEPHSDDAGLITFFGGAVTQTSINQGIALKYARITAPGKVRFRPSFVSPVLANATYAAPSEFSARAPANVGEELTVPLYRPAARRPFSVLEIGAGEILISEKPLTRLAPEPVAERREYTGPESATAARSPLMKAAKADAGGLAPTPRTEARALPKPMAYARVPLAITGCALDLGLFVDAGINAPEVHPPFTVTLTDMTPPTGGGAGNRVVDFQGIRDHRIEKKVRLKIDIKDAYGATPNYPVLVQLAVGGPRHGSLILDPDGAMVTCSEASFLWHENGGTSNELFDYKLGTLSLFAGVTQDDTGAYKPVWDEAEALGMRVSTIDSGGAEIQWATVWGVLPEPGKPDHFACYQFDGSACPDVFRFWSGYLALSQGGHLSTAPYYEFTAYRLDDEYNNMTYGYSRTSMTAPASNVTAQFFDQLPGTPGPLWYIDLGHYGFVSTWTNVPAWPNGNLPSTIRVDYDSDPDGDWTSGSVTKDITYQFDTGTSHALIQSTTYDLVKPDRTKGVTDGKFPMFVRPGMLAANMPKTEAGDTRRLTLLIVSGALTWDDWWETYATITDWNYAEPYSAGTRFWRTSDGGNTFSFGSSYSDPKLELTDSPAFRLTLIDSANQRVIDGASFRVHRCPRFDHESQSRACATLPVDSVNGVVDNFHVNEGGDYRGYVAFELTKAPLATGEYFIRAESLGQNYRVRRQGDFNVSKFDTANGEWTGAFSIAIVDDPELNCACETCPEWCMASPNFIGTGTYQARAVDLTLPTPGFPVQVSRRYLSSNRRAGAFGPGWSTSLESRIWFSTYIAGSGLSAPAANVLLPGGEQFRFTINGLTGGFDPPVGRRDMLVRNPSDLSFDFTVQRSRTVYHFDKDGRLTLMIDEFGNAVTVTYNAAGQAQRIADQAGSGRYIDVSWRADGKVDYVQDSAGRRVSYGYAADGTLTSATDPASRATHYHYTNGAFGPLLDQISDNWNRLLTVVTYDVGDRTNSYSENLELYMYSYVNGTTVTKTDSSGATSTFTTAPSGQITNRTAPPASGSGTAHTDYNADGSVAGTTDEVGVRTNYTYDANGRVATATRDATGSSPVRFEYAYDPAFPEKVTSVTPKNPGTNAFDPNWQGWRYDYLASGALNHVYRLRNDGGSTDTISTFQYDAKGRVTQQTSATGAVTDYSYSGADLSTVTQPSNADSGARPVTQYSNYDGAGRPRTITDPALNDTTYTYDALGRVLTVTLPKPTPSFPGNFTTTYAYDNYDGATGLVFTNITDPNGKLTKLGYDEHGRLLKSIDAAGNTTRYAYTGASLTSITDANDNATTYHYDALKRLDTTIFPDGKTETYTYYADGLLKTKTDRMGQTLTYEYDAFKRLKKKIYPNPAQTITYTYQGQKLTQVDDLYASPAETHTFGYDNSYRVNTNVQSTRGTLTYTYTPDDRVDTMTIAGTPNVTTAHTYYADGSLKTIVWSPQTGQFKYDYTARGQYQTVTFPNGQTRSYSYDDQGRLTNLANALGATNIATYAYGYDVDWASGLNTMLGQRVSMTATVPSQGFNGALTKYSYDPLYQLKKAEYPNVAPFNNEVHQWTYDAIGNRLTNQVNAAIQTYTYEKIGLNPKNAQKLLGDGVNTYAYDFNGSQTSRTGFGFGSDADNRLSSITGGTAASYTYDYQGRRTSKTVAGVTTKYLYDGLNLVRETKAGVNSDYTFGPSIDEPLALYSLGAVSYLAVDGLGSVVGETNATGVVQHSSIFDVWGVTKTETGTRFSAFGYTGREFGEAGLWFYRARWVDSRAGRLTAEDPSEALAGAHLYRYVESDPVKFKDPHGLSAIAAAPSAAEWLITNGPKAINAGRAFAGLLNPITWLPALLLYEGPVGKDDTFLPEETEAMAVENMPCPDPCKGLRKELVNHLMKLARYKRSPDAEDNRGLLVGASPERRESVISGRLRRLGNQVANFRKLLLDCIKNGGPLQ